MTTVDNQKKSPTSGKNEDPKEKGFLNRPRAGGKTMWDWLNLLGILAIPLVVAGATLFFGIQQANLANQQHENDQKIANQQHEADKQSALDQQQAAILQTYIDNIQDLLLNHNLLKSKPTDEVAILAKARTLTALQGLDPDRKGILLLFVYDAQLIGFVDTSLNKNNLHGPIIDLIGADLRDAQLNSAFLNRADLNYAILSGAQLNSAFLISAKLSGTQLNSAYLRDAELRDADLSNATLSSATLSNATLINADLSNADLSNATLSNADLSNATLSGADLNGAKLSNTNITQQQLDQIYTCKGAILPQGLICHNNP